MTALAIVEPLARVRKLMVAAEFATRLLTDGVRECVPDSVASHNFNVIDAGFDHQANTFWIIIESPDFELVDPNDPPEWAPTFRNPELRCPSCGQTGGMWTGQ